MQNFIDQLGDHIDFSYSCFDRVVLRGYMPHLFVEGSVVKLLRNMGFKRHTNGVFKLLTDQFNAHIKKVSEKQDIPIHWWGQPEKEAYHCKLELVKDKELGLCYLKLSSYLPFVSEFYKDVYTRQP